MPVPDAPPDTLAVAAGIAWLPAAQAQEAARKRGGECKGGGGEADGKMATYRRVEHTSKVPLLHQKGSDLGDRLIDFRCVDR